MLNKIRRVRSVLRKPANQRSLSEKLVISGALTSTEIAVTMLIRIGSTLILTRLLSPDVYGLFAVILTFHVIISTVTDFGARELILVSKGDEPPEFLRTCWTIQILRGIFVFSVVACIALGLYGLQFTEIIAPDTVYSAPDLPAALAVSTIMLLFTACESVNYHVYTKNMHFGAVVVMNIIYQSVYIVASIGVAFYYPSIWALVIGGFFAGLIKLIMTYTLFSGERMRFCLDSRYSREILGQGKWIVVQSIMTAFTNQADRVLLSIFLPSSLFGLYYLAKQFYDIPINLIRRVNGSFGIQFFTEILKMPQADMQQRYYKYRIPFDAMVCFFAGGFLTASPAVMDLLYDPRYLETGSILQVLGIGLPLVCIGIVRDAFIAEKQFKQSAFFGFLQAVSMWIGLLLALMVFESPYAAFLVISLYRLPDLAVMLTNAWRVGWINPLKEVRVFPVIGLGALAGWGLSLAIGSILA